jgi:NAD(P)-dependent dehydrogenase (short-subunit alcohol dehydrogenase family)
VARRALTLLLKHASASRSASLGAKSRAADVVSAFREEGLQVYITDGRGAAVITRGNSGIGLECVKQLLSSGCKRVVLCSRDVEAGKRALASLEGTVDLSRARVQRLDLADLDSICDACREIKRKERSVALLLNNAGVLFTPPSTTKQWYELQFGTNHIGHHALTRLLLPCMTPDARVVTVSSEAPKFARFDVTDLMFTRRKYKPFGAYCQSKAANILFAKGLADELSSAGSSIKSVSLHPGIINTPIWKHGRQRPGGRLFTWLMHRFILDKDVEQGAATSVYAALAPAGALKDGAYLNDCAEAQPNPVCSDEDKALRRQLWDATERMLSEAGLKLPGRLLG